MRKSVSKKRINCMGAAGTLSARRVSSRRASPLLTIFQNHHRFWTFSQRNAPELNGRIVAIQDHSWGAAEIIVFRSCIWYNVGRHYICAGLRPTKGRHTFANRVHPAEHSMSEGHDIMSADIISAPDCGRPRGGNPLQTVCILRSVSCPKDTI